LFATPFGQALELVPTAANRQPALAVYAPDRTPFAIKVFTVSGSHFSAITGFVSSDVFASFDLPDLAPAAAPYPDLDRRGNDARRPLPN